MFPSGKLNLGEKSIWKPIVMKTIPFWENFLIFRVMLWFIGKVSHSTNPAAALGPLIADYFTLLIRPSLVSRDQTSSLFMLLLHLVVSCVQNNVDNNMAILCIHIIYIIYTYYICIYKPESPKLLVLIFPRNITIIKLFYILNDL